MDRSALNELISLLILSRRYNKPFSFVASRTVLKRYSDIVNCLFLAISDLLIGLEVKKI